jgi:hypothetical protein
MNLRWRSFKTMKAISSNKWFLKIFTLESKELNYYKNSPCYKKRIRNLSLSSKNLRWKLKKKNYNYQVQIQLTKIILLARIFHLHFKKCMSNLLNSLIGLQINFNCKKLLPHVKRLLQTWEINGPNNIRIQKC